VMCSGLGRARRGGGEFGGPPCGYLTRDLPSPMGPRVELSGRKGKKFGEKIWLFVGELIREGRSLNANAIEKDNRRSSALRVTNEGEP